MSSVTILLSALPFEGEIIRRLLKGEKVVHGSWILGYLKERLILLAASGVGGEQCTHVLTAILDEYPHSEVLFLGTAGALNPVIKIGDVVVANRPISWELPEEPIQKIFGATCSEHDFSGIKRGDDSFHIFRGTVATLDEPVFDETLRSWLSTVLRAHCVDMETGYGAHLCKNRNVPFLAVRGISDIPKDGIYKYSNKAHAVWHAALVALEALLSPVPVSVWPTECL